MLYGHYAGNNKPFPDYVQEEKYMPAIKVFMKDGTIQDFPETSCSGGSYCTSLHYEEGFAVIEDAYGRETSIPSTDIEKIVKESNRRTW
jgi:hypothetical protein